MLRPRWLARFVGVSLCAVWLGGCVGSAQTTQTQRPATLQITTASLPGGTVSQAYSATVSASGGTAPYQWSIASGTLPAGLTLASSTGVLSGTPTASGSFSFAVQVKDAASNTNQKSFSITIQAAVPPLQITTSSLPGGTVSQAYSAAVSASGGMAPYQWSIASGTLPAGLTLASSTGVLSGTPTASGSFSFTVQVKDTAGTTNQKSFSITIQAATAPLQITTSSLPGGTVSQSYSATVSASGGTAPYQWSISSGTLPAGLTLASSSGVLSGTPTASGSFSFTVQVKDTAGTTNQKSFSITIQAATAPLQITTSSLPGGTVSQSYSATVSASGGTAPYQWSIASGTLPAGLTLSSSSGVLSGTPTASGSFSFTVQVKDTAGTTNQKSFSITIQAATAPLQITTSSLPGGTVSQAYSATVSASGGTAPYQWSVASGALPSGLTLASSTGLLSGTPTTSGSFSFTVQVKDAASNTNQKSFSITIQAAVPPLQITTSSLPGGTVSQAFSATVSASGGTTPYQWSVASGTLPAGLTLASSSGVLSGTPTASGSFSFTVQVKDTAGTTNQKSFSITIQAATAPLQITTSSLPGGTVSQAYSATVSASGGTAPYQWSIASGTLPGGVTLASSSGVLSGTPTASGSFSFTVQVKDAASKTATKSYTLTIAADPPATSCDAYASPSGSDSNAGTLSAPWQTLQHAFNALQPGQTLCLRAGTYPQVSGGLFSQIMSTSGTASAPITITNYPGEVAIVHGATKVEAAYVTVQGTPVTGSGLIFEGPTGLNVGLIEVSNSHDITFDHVEIRNDDYHAGFYQYNGYNIRLLGSYIHDNGVAGNNLDQGIYWDQTAGGGNLIANCLVEHNAANGIQLYASATDTEPTQVTVEDNTSINNGHYGIDVYGGQNVIVNNIFAGNGTVFNSPQMVVAAGTNHIIDSNIMWSTTVSHQGVYNQTGQVITNTIIADPLFADPANHDYHLLIGSPAIGVGNPSYQQPVDKDGVTRGPSDLGAYEFVP